MSFTGSGSFTISIASVGHAFEHPPQPMHETSATFSVGTILPSRILLRSSMSVTLSDAKRILFTLVMVPSKNILIKFFILLPQTLFQVLLPLQGKHCLLYTSDAADEEDSV